MDITWRADFDLCTLMVLGIFVLIYRKKDRFRSLGGRLYELMLTLLSLATAVEYAEVYFSHIKPIATSTVKCILLCAYEDLICMLAFTFSLYIFIVARKGIYTKRRWIWYAIYFPALVTLILINSTQATHLIFYFEDGHFNMGPLYFGVYAIIAAYLLFAAAVIVVLRKNILRRNRIAFFAYLFLGSCGMIYQAVTIGGLVSNFLSALGLIIIYSSQQSNFDTLDTNSNLYNRQALLLHINELINDEQPFRIIAIAPDKIFDILRDKGSFYTDAIIRAVGDRLRDIYGATGTYTLGSGRFAIVTFDEWKDQVRETVNKCTEQPVFVGDEKFLLTTSGCYLEYPDNFETGDMALEMIARGMDIASKGEDNTLVTIDNYESIRDNLVAKLQQEQIILEREKEAALVEKENAESSDRAKTSFLAHMSHEIRTPLTTIMGMTEILQRSNLSDYARTNIEKIHSAGKSLLQIINDILDFSKIEAGRMELVNEPFDVIQVIESASNVLKVRSTNKPIKLIYDIADDIPSRLIGDDTRIKQVLFNLLSNAAKYTEEGSITFTVKWFELESKLFVSVRDTGRGIREADMSRLFESFSRFDAHANKAVEGTGLGLAITKRMVELMGGELHVESEYGKGSCFSFEIVLEVVDRKPISEVGLERSAEINLSETGIEYFVAPEAKVLVVDDNGFNRTIAEELIRPHRLIVSQAASGPECIEMVAKTDYDIIFLDHMMPGMDGFETLRHLREDSHFAAANIPVIAFSANAISGMKEKFNEGGFTGFLSKPIDVKELESMLLRYLPKDKVQMISEAEFKRNLKEDEGQPLSEGISVSYLKEKLKSLDIDTGLAHVNGDIERFFKLIKVILSDKDSIRKRLNSTFEAEDTDGYTIDVHALKSNLASIGATKAAEFAKALEEAGHRGDKAYIQSNHIEMMDLHADICAELENAVTDYESRLSTDEAGEEQFRKELAELMPDFSDCAGCIRVLLDEFEYDTAIRLAELFGKLMTEEEQRSQFERIADKLSMFDYDGARELL